MQFLLLKKYGDNLCNPLLILNGESVSDNRKKILLLDKSREHVSLSLGGLKNDHMLDGTFALDNDEGHYKMRFDNGFTTYP